MPKPRNRLRDPIFIHPKRIFIQRLDRLPAVPSSTEAHSAAPHTHPAAACTCLFPAQLHLAPTQSPALEPQSEPARVDQDQAKPQDHGPPSVKVACGLPEAVAVPNLLRPHRRLRAKPAAPTHAGQQARHAANRLNSPSLKTLTAKAHSTPGDYATVSGGSPGGGTSRTFNLRQLPSCFTSEGLYPITYSFRSSALIREAMSPRSPKIRHPEQPPPGHLAHIRQQHRPHLLFLVVGAYWSKIPIE